MPLIEANGIRLNYFCEGPEHAPVVAFSNGLGTNLHMWDEQASALQQRFRVLRYDTRGHGKSEVTDAPYTIEQLATDFLSLLDALGIQRCDFCGLSMGGMVGLWIAVHHPEAVNKMVVANTAAKIGTADMWNQRIVQVLNEGMASVADGMIPRWFTPRFQQSQQAKLAKVRQAFESTDPRGYVGSCEAIRDMDQRATVGTIKLAMMIISGDQDPVIPPSESDVLASAIPGARQVRLPAAHLSNLECPDDFNKVLISYFEVR